MLLGVREGPRSGASGSGGNRGLWSWFSPVQHFLNFFPKGEFLCCFHKHADVCMSCSTPWSRTLTLSPLCSFGYHNIKKYVKLLESIQRKIYEDGEQSKGSLMSVVICLVQPGESIDWGKTMFWSSISSQGEAEGQELISSPWWPVVEDLRKCHETVSRKI